MELRRSATRAIAIAIAVAGVVLGSLAIGTCLLLGTVGWLVVGFGTMTECTNDYSCSVTSCEPCATTAFWTNAGGVGQLLLAGVAIAILVLASRARRWTLLLAGGSAVLAASVLTIGATTWLAEESFCQPGTAGYAASYCSTDD